MTSDRFTVYQTARGGGKTSWIISQVAGLLSSADSPLEIAILVPSENFKRQFYDRHVPLAIYTEKDVIQSRGRQFDYVFVDNADLFTESPLVLCNEIAPGKPAFLTYTPLSSKISSLPKSLPKTRQPAFTEKQLVMLYMLAYIYRTNRNSER